MHAKIIFLELVHNLVPEVIKLISLIKKMFSSKKAEFVSWNTYTSHIDELNDHFWRQNVRKRSLQNI